MNFTYSKSLGFSLQICLMSLKQFFKKVSVTDDFINLGCLSISFIEYYGTFMDLQLAYHLYKPFLLLEVLENFVFMIGYRYDALLFCAKDFLVLFYYACCVFEFLYSLSKLVQLFRFDGIVDRSTIYQLLFNFVFIETLYLLGVFRTSPEL